MRMLEICGISILIALEVPIGDLLMWRFRTQGMWLTANLHWPWVKRSDHPARPQTGPLVDMAELPTQTFRRRKGDSSHWRPLRVFDIYKDRRRTSQLPSSV